MKKFFILALLLLPLVANAKSNKNVDDSNSSHSKVFTGFSGGMMIHGGYAFSSNPAEMFHNMSMTGTSEYIKSLPKDGVTLGLGGQLRFHLFNHMHLGGEGHVSIMPLAGESSIRNAWGGGFIDGYVTAGPVRPLLGIGIGGGRLNRLFVPSSLKDVINIKDSIAINASYSRTPYFYIDPYIGLEILLRNTKSIFIRLDYQLPFSKNKDEGNTDKPWSTFVKPSGPRLYIGIMFGKQK